jgi:excinuclease ABC subunit C
MPQSPGIYRMIGEDGHPLYIGKAKNLPKRVTSYTQTDKLPYRLQRMVSFTKSMDFTITRSEAEALLLEANLVHKLQPKFNIDLKDDKSFPYILLTSDKEYDMMIKYRGKKEAKGNYFGPFANAGVVTQTLAVLQKAFPLRTCSDHALANRDRPCIEYQIKRCTAPCVGKISQPDYAQIVADAKSFLKGRRADVQQRLSAQMEEFSAKLEFEKAAQVRDRIQALTKIQNENKVSFSGIDDADVIGLIKEGPNTCIQVFFVRAGQNFGNKPYFPRHMEDASEADILSGFIGQFYQTNEPPKRILLGHSR